MFMHTLKPSTPVYYSHKGSFYQCSGNGDLAGLLDPAPDTVLQLGTPPPGCTHWDARQTSKWVWYIIGHNWRAYKLTHKAYRPPRTELAPVVLLQHQGLLRAALWQELCSASHGLWRLAPDVAATVEREIQRLSSLQATVVVVRARGGDKVIEFPRSKTVVSGGARHYAVAPGLRALLRRRPELQGTAVCIVIGDDPGVAQAVKQDAEGTGLCREVVLRVDGGRNAAHVQAVFNARPLEERCAAAKSLLVDIQLMAWAHYLVANPYSNVDSLARLLRKCQFAHDDSSYIDGASDSLDAPVPITV